MNEPETRFSWKFEEELLENGVRKVYVRVPGAANFPEQVRVQIRREIDPPFLRSDGWEFEAELFEPESMEKDGDDLLVEIPQIYADLIDDFEPVEISIDGSELIGALPWVMEPRIKKTQPSDAEVESGLVEDIPAPAIVFSSNLSNVKVGDTVTLVWTVGNISSLKASGAWNGIRPASGSEDVFISNAGVNEFTLSAETPSGELKKTVVVNAEEKEVQRFPKWVKIAIGVLIIALLAGLVLWLYPNRERDPKPSYEHADNSSASGSKEIETNPPNHGNTDNTGSENTKPGDKTESKDNFEKLKRLLSERQYDAARKLLYDLTGNGHTGAALIAAETLGAAKFTPGLFENRNNNVALQYFRLACNGRVGARSSLEQWQQQLREEQRMNPSEGVKEAIDQKIPDLMKSCKD